MTDRARIRIAAAVTALFLAGISAAGLAVRDRPQPVATAATQQVAPSATGASASPAVRSEAGEGEEGEHDD